MPDGLEIYFSESLTPDQRKLAEESVVSMVERARTQAEAVRARWAEEDKLRDAAMAPLAKLMQADPAAVAAMEKLSKLQLDAEDSLRVEELSGAARNLMIPLSPTDRAIETRVSPYDFGWRWHDTGGAPPHSQIGDQRGFLGADARAGGLMPGGADRRVNAHIGVGVIVRLDRTTVIDLFSTRDSLFSYIVGSRGVGANATSEGGLETTFMRGPTVLEASTLPLWRRRVSGFEEARDRRNWMRGIFPDGMGGRFDRGDYAYNVGMWSFADYSSGIGSAGVQSLCQSNIIDMRIGRR